MAQTEQERILYDAREKAIRDEVSRNSWYARRFDDGLEKGRREERELMRRRARLVEQINIKEAELGKAVSPWVVLLDQPEDELQRILSNLVSN